MLTDILDAFETDLAVAEQSDTAGKVARKVCAQIDALQASVDTLPDNLKPTMPTEDEVQALRALTGAVVSPQLQEYVKKVQAALLLGEDAGIADFDFDKARTLVERYNSLLTSSGKGKGGGNSGTGSRGFTHAIRVVMPDGKVRTSHRGDWTNIRWQITDDAKDHEFVSKEALDAVLVAIKKYEADGGEPVNITVPAGDGAEYMIHYPG